MKSVAFRVECRELRTDKELALASASSDSLKRDGIALMNGEKIVFDSFRVGQLDEKVVESVISGFVAHRKKHEQWSVGRAGDSLVRHSAGPVAAARKWAPGGTSS
jgi:hypothetical protein